MIAQSGANSAKLLMSVTGMQKTEQQFDANMQPFLKSTNPDLAAAAKVFQAQMLGFFSLVQSYNGKLLDINSLQPKILELGPRSKRSRGRSPACKHRPWAIRNHNRPYAAYMGQAYATTRDELLRQTYFECRVGYWALQPLPLSQVLGAGAPLAVTVADFPTCGIRSRV